jgi:CRP-like cAMP-binding protein
VTSEQEIREGEFVVRIGDSDRCLYMIVEGEVEVRRGERSLARLAAGEFFGEIALLEDSPRTADVVALSRGRVLRLSRPELLRLMHDLPGIGIAIGRTLARRVREMNDRVARSGGSLRAPQGT